VEAEAIDTVCLLYLMCDVDLCLY